MPYRAETISEELMEIIREFKRHGKTWADCAKATGLTSAKCQSQSSRLGFIPLHPCKFPKYEGHKPKSKSPYVPQTSDQPLRASPLPPGAKTLPVLPCLLEPIYIIQNK